MEKKPVKPDKTPIGYQFDCIIDNIQPEVNGHGYITLKTHAKINEDVFSLLGTPLNCALKKQKTKRTINANSYCWELCKQIAEKAGISSMDVYREAVREYGVYEDYIVEEKKIKEITDAWESFGIGWITDRVDFADKEKVIIRCYFGTSAYDSLQMTKIINYLVNEANDLGITILSERKRKELLKEWKETGNEIPTVEDK